MLNKVKTSTISLDDFSCPSILQQDCLPHVCNTFGLLRWPDGWMTGHMTWFLHKQLDAPSVGIAVGDSFLSSYFYVCFDFESLIGCQNMSYLWSH